jgi:hypothetical protein
MYPHFKRESLTHGRSPGNGITPTPLSAEPLATEGEATPGPDDYNPYEEREFEAAMNAQAKRDPTAAPDPFAFDDIAAGMETMEIDFPDLGDGPETGGFL